MGGAENQLVSIADELVMRGHTVTLAYVLQPAVVLPRSELVRVIWLGGGRSIFAIFKAFLNLRGLVEKFRPDVVHSNMYHANIMCRLVGLIIPLPRLICTAHSTNEGGLLRMCLYRSTDSLADEFTCVSKGGVVALERMKAAPAGRMKILYNGIDTHRFRFNLSARNKIRSDFNLNDCRVFIAVGRFHLAKDYPNLLNAFALLSADHPECHLLIVGDGELRSEIEGVINILNLKSRVTLLGVREDIPELLSAADFFVLSSLWEGFGLVVAEAMSTERMVVATDCGGVSEVLDKYGYLVSPGDCNALAQCMKNAIGLSSDLVSMNARGAREYVVKKFGLAKIVDEWLRLYQS
jgi:glycosyltransferase involved in cell wall biosynthesis